MVALSPALILAAFINWDLIALALTALGMAAWAARRGVLGGRAPRPGRGDQVLPAAGLRAAAAALPAGRPAAGVREDLRRGGAGLAGGQPAGHDRRAVRLGPLLRVQPATGAPTGARSGTCSSTTSVPVLGELPAEHPQRHVRRGPDRRLRRDRAARPGRAAPAAAAAAVLPAAGRVPDHEQGLVAAVRHLAGAAGRAGPAAAGGRTCCGSWRRSATSSASGATSSSSPWPGPCRIRLPGHQHRLVLRRAARQVPHRGLLAA